MVDNRSNGFLVSAFSFKAGDASGMANAMNGDSQGQGAEYFAPEENKSKEAEKQKQAEFIDRSSQLTGALDSLAALNAANIERVKKEIEKKARERIKSALKKNKKKLGHIIDNYERNGS